MSEDELLQFANQLADAAAEVVLPHFRSALAVENKAGPAAFDPVTVADRDAETAMRALITRHHPDHGILGEEHGIARGSSDLTWVLDPIDGTRGFMCGLTTWGTLIGVRRGDRPIAGVMSQPYVGERFLGGAGRAELVTRDGRRTALRTRSCGSLEEAVLSTTSPEAFAPEELPAFERVRRRVRLTRYGGDCYAYCLVAAGLIDLVVESNLKPYDIVALIPLIEAAGGIVTTWDGGPAHEGGRVIAAGDRALHAAVLPLLHA
jgi:histidinol phosphatase-like enzyme (inositol monophosphatase family)